MNNSQWPPQGNQGPQPHGSGQPRPQWGPAPQGGAPQGWQPPRESQQRPFQGQQPRPGQRPPQSQPPATPQQPKKKSKTGLIIGAVLAGLVLLGLLIWGAVSLIQRTNILPSPAPAPSATMAGQPAEWSFKNSRVAAIRNTWIGAAYRDAVAPQAGAEPQWVAHQANGKIIGAFTSQAGAPNGPAPESWAIVAEEADGEPRTVVYDTANWREEHVYDGLDCSGSDGSAAGGFICFEQLAKDTFFLSLFDPSQSEPLSVASMPGTAESVELLTMRDEFGMVSVDSSEFSGVVLMDESDILWQGELEGHVEMCMIFEEEAACVTDENVIQFFDLRTGEPGRELEGLLDSRVVWTMDGVIYETKHGHMIAEDRAGESLIPSPPADLGHHRGIVMEGEFWTDPQVVETTGTGVPVVAAVDGERMLADPESMKLTDRLTPFEEEGTLYSFSRDARLLVPLMLVVDEDAGTSKLLGPAPGGPGQGTPYSGSIKEWDTELRIVDGMFVEEGTDGDILHVPAPQR